MAPSAAGPKPKHSAYARRAGRTGRRHFYDAFIPLFCGPYLIAVA
jgi:hypothetical protein